MLHKLCMLVAIVAGLWAVPATKADCATDTECGCVEDCLS